MEVQIVDLLTEGRGGPVEITTGVDGCKEVFKGYIVTWLGGVNHPEKETIINVAKT